MFVQQSFMTVYPDQCLEPNWHIDAIIHALERNLSGECPQLIINLPPRQLKSFLVSICWPAFLLTRDPSLKIICVSYSDELAKTIARDFRRLVESDWYQALFPEVVMVKFTESEAVTQRGGFRTALSVHGSITGRGADLIIVDDPCRPEEALSDTIRMKINNWFLSTLMSRRDDKMRGGLIIVMQRLHVNDLVGFVEERRGFHKLSLPAIAMQDETIELRRGRQHVRRAGDALQPERESVQVLEDLRSQIGPFLFAAQYQQSPTTPDGQLFRRKHFHLVDKIPPIDRRGEVYLSIDSALSTASTADYTAMSVVYIRDRRLYVLHVERGRYGYEKLKERTMAWIAKLCRHEVRVNVVVEKAGSGIALYQHLADSRDPRFTALSYLPRENKLYRAAQVLPMVEKGIYLRNVQGNNAWVEPYINEFMNFPNGANDDQVDSLVQLLQANRVRVLLLQPTGAAV
jgi:predicted phage terminase large subunit-like protein